MSFRAFICLTLLFLLMASPVNAQPAGWNIMAKPSFRIGYLYGSQVASIVTDYGSSDSFRSFDPPNVQLDISFGYLVLTGVVELSTGGPFSARLSADASVYGQQNMIYGSWWTSRNPAPYTPDGLYSGARPGYAAFEAAGQYDIWRYPGYSFGVTGGWRSEHWWHSWGNNDSLSYGAGDNVTSSIPFAGLSAEMAYPGWRSTWQLLASPFIWKNVDGWVRDRVNSAEYQFPSQDGLLLEGRIEGQANVTDNLLMGIYGRYSYQNLSGIFDVVTSPVASWPVNVVESALMLQLQGTYLFW